MNPQFPIYIISKGRYETRHTARYFEKIGIRYFIVVEEQEAEQYKAVINPSWGTVLILDEKYKQQYDIFKDIGAKGKTGSGPARNFSWEHSIGLGAEWHWVVDDNISFFARFNKNLKVPVADGTIFKCMEDFCLRYENIAMAGPQYEMFIPRKKKVPPLTMNTRIYSCILIRNDIPFRWRGRYNEDTDLSLRVLKAGWCTVLFNAFLQKKLTTLLVKGGNTDEIYASSADRLAKSQMLVDMHPDVARIGWRFNRVHHIVDYSNFKWLKLIRKPGVISGGIDNYKMELRPVWQKEKVAAHATHQPNATGT